MNSISRIVDGKQRAMSLDGTKKAQELQEVVSQVNSNLLGLVDWVQRLVLFSVKEVKKKKEPSLQIFQTNQSLRDLLLLASKGDTNTQIANAEITRTANWLFDLGIESHDSGFRDLNQRLAISRLTRVALTDPLKKLYIEGQKPNLISTPLYKLGTFALHSLFQDFNPRFPNQSEQKNILKVLEEFGSFDYDPEYASKIIDLILNPYTKLKVLTKSLRALDTFSSLPFRQDLFDFAWKQFRAAKDTNHDLIFSSLKILLKQIQSSKPEDLDNEKREILKKDLTHLFKIYAPNPFIQFYSMRIIAELGKFDAEVMNYLYENADQDEIQPLIPSFLARSLINNPKAKSQALFDFALNKLREAKKMEDVVLLGRILTVIPAKQSILKLLVSNILEMEQDQNHRDKYEILTTVLANWIYKNPNLRISDKMLAKAKSLEYNVRKQFDEQIKIDRDYVPRSANIENRSVDARVLTNCFHILSLIQPPNLSDYSYQALNSRSSELQEIGSMLVHKAIPKLECLLDLYQRTQSDLVADTIQDLLISLTNNEDCALKGLIDSRFYQDDGNSIAIPKIYVSAKLYRPDSSSPTEAKKIIRALYKKYHAVQTQTQTKANILNMLNQIALNCLEPLKKFYLSIAANPGDKFKEHLGELILALEPDFQLGDHLLN